MIEKEVVTVTEDREWDELLGRMWAAFEREAENLASEEAAAWRERLPVKMEILLPAGLAERLREEAWIRGYGVDDLLALFLDRKYRDWLPPQAKRAWRQEVRRRCRYWQPRIYSRKGGA